MSASEQEYRIGNIESEVNWNMSELKVCEGVTRCVNMPATIQVTGLDASRLSSRRQRARGGHWEDVDGKVVLETRTTEWLQEGAREVGRRRLMDGKCLQEEEEVEYGSV